MVVMTYLLVINAYFYVARTMCEKSLPNGMWKILKRSASSKSWEEGRDHCKVNTENNRAL